MGDIVSIIIKKIKHVRPEFIFYIFFGFYLLLMFSSNLALNLYEYHWFRRLNYLFSLICPVYYLINILWIKPQRFKILFIHLIFTAIFFIVSFNCGDFSIFNTWLLILCISGMNMNKIAKFVLIFSIIYIFVIVCLSGLGIIENKLYPRYEGSMPVLARFSYGFANPNALAAFLFQIACCLVYLKWNHWNIMENFLILLLFWVIYSFLNCRTVSILIMLLLILVNLCKYKLKDKSIIFLKYFSLFSLIFCPFFSFLTVILYGKANSSAALISDLLSHRIRNLFFSLNYYDISIFGNIYHRHKDFLIVDNPYGNIFIHFGVLVFILYMVLYLIAINYTIKFKNVPFLILLTVYLYYGIMEGYIINPYSNFTIFIFSIMFYNRNLLTSDKTECM